jgi:glycosyltransferase involved in cell wall biosynthesis
MKILVFSEKFMLPTLTFIYNEVAEMSKYHEVITVCNEHFIDEKFPFVSVVKVPFKEKLIRRKLTWYGEKFGFFMTRKNADFKTGIRKLINDFKPEIIHTHFGYESIKLLDNLNIPPIPVFISFHGYDASQMLKRKVYVNKLNQYLKYDNIIPICVSGFIKKNLFKAGVNVNKAELLYYGINIDFFNPVIDKVRNDKFTFLQISSFNEKKGHIYTLQAFKLFLDKVEKKNNYKLILAGGWGLFEQIKAEAGLMGLSEFVEFTGVVNQEQAKELLSKANAFLHHSITAPNGDTEGMPNAIIEAMAMELPVISTFHAGIPELVEHGVNGFLVQEKDIDTYAKSMKDILSWERLPHSRRKVIENFSNQAHCRKLQEIYQKYIS